MSTDRRKVMEVIRRFEAAGFETDFEAALLPKISEPGSLPAMKRSVSEAALRQRLERAGASDHAAEALLDESTRSSLGAYEGFIENMIGTAKVPLGLVGPMRVNGLHARGDYHVPLATSEAALVGSYARGARVISRAGGASALVLGEAIARSPCFVFARLADAGRFVAWLAASYDEIKSITESTTAHGRLLDLRFTVEGNHVYVAFEYETGEACGQNMVTVATRAAMDWILAHAPTQPQHAYLEANLSGDKKSSAQSFCLMRGRKASADVVVPADILRDELRCSAEQMAAYWRVSALGGVQSGTLGVQGQFANGLAGLYIACGQDAACVAESAVGVTRLEVADDGALYAAVSLPNLMVGTVGGGTSLPSARACLDMLGLHGEGSAAALAEIAAVLLLAGELSLIGAIASGQFSRAHALLRRQERARMPSPDST
jgi:hydroxymethylglutaryl-CoA reductase (NADPH)